MHFCIFVNSKVWEFALIDDKNHRWPWHVYGFGAHPIIYERRENKSNKITSNVIADKPNLNLVGWTYIPLSNTETMAIVVSAKVLYGNLFTYGRNCRTVSIPDFSRYTNIFIIYLLFIIYIKYIYYIFARHNFIIKILHI